MSKILVQSKPERLRRAGIEFNRPGVELETDDLSPEQLEAINAEPLLAVTDVATGEAVKKPAKGKGTK